MLTRLISGVAIYAFVCIYIIYLGKNFMQGLMVGCSVLIAWEWLSLLDPRKHRKSLMDALEPARLMILLAPMILANFVMLVLPQEQYYIPAVAGCLWFGYAIWGLYMYEKDPDARELANKNSGSRAQAAKIGSMVFCLSSFAFFALLIYDISPVLVLVVITLVGAVDSGGYIFGNLLGGKRLCPNLSPNKTWNGLGGGCLLAVAVYCVLALVLDELDFSWAAALLMIPFAILTQLGDLYQSRLKRLAKTKDSGNLIPGHGGLFDRADGLLWSPLPFYIIHISTSI